jgi:hypothetical protein
MNKTKKTTGSRQSGRWFFLVATLELARTYQIQFKLRSNSDQRLI